MSVAKRWRVVHQPAVWRRKEPTTGGRAVALMKEGTEFDATGAFRISKEGMWIFGEDTDPKKSGWVLVDGSALGLGPLIEPMDLDRSNIWPGKLKKRLQRKALNRPGDMRELGWYDLDKVNPVIHWHKEGNSETDAGVSFARWRDGRWICLCGAAVDGADAFVKGEKNLAEVAQRIFAIGMPDQRRASTAGVKGLILPGESFVLAALSLADDAGCLFGRRHWIWQMGLLFAVDLDLSLSRYTYMKWDGEFLLGTASMLLEVWDWLTSLGLSQEPGYFLHGRASRLLREMDGAEPPDSIKDRFQYLQTKLRQRLDSLSPAVSILPSRDFIPESLFIAH